LCPQIKKLTGAQRLIFELARAVTEAGHRVTLVTHRIHDEPRAAIPAAVRVIETGRRVDRFGQHYADAALEYVLAPVLVRDIPSDVDALVCFGPPSMPALRWARRRGWGAPSRPLLAFLYEPPRFVDRDRADVIAGLGWKGRVIGPFLGLYRFVDRRLVREADALLANGDYGAARLRTAYGRPATVLPHGVDFRTPDAEEVGSVRARFGMPGDAPFALTVNQLHPRKRLDLFIGTVAAARRTIPKLRGLIVGRGVDEGHLRAEAARLGVTDTITFAGFVPDADLPALYAAATLYLHTGRDETLGLSVLEAAWSGTPVVAVDEGGPRDILRAGETGWLTPANVPALAAAVAAVLRDPATARERAQRAQADVRGRFRWEDGARSLITEVTRLRDAR
jgi:glycosyltransferase involved in cell wall biosynthesis